MIKCDCGRTVSGKINAELSGWVYENKKWCCQDCAVENLIEAMEVA